MTDVSDFQRGQIVNIRMAGASETKTDQMLGISRNTIGKVMRIFVKLK